MERIVEKIIEKEVPVEPEKREVEIQYQPVYMPMPVQMQPVLYQQPVQYVVGDYQVDYGTQNVETTEVERQDLPMAAETTETVVQE